MISVLSFGYLYWSSSWRWQAHIRGCKLLRPLPRAEMGDFGPVFRKMYFLWVWWSPKKVLVQIFWVLPPKTGYFAQPPETSLPLCGNWGCTEGEPQFPQSYDRCNIYAQPSRGGEQYLCEVAMQINYWSLIINLWCFVIKFANSSVQPQFPQSGILQPQFPQSDHTPQRRSIYVEICVEIFGEIFLGHPEHWVKGVFEKNGTQFGQLLPRWPHLQSATPYMASPPCTIFHNPDLKWNIVQQCTIKRWSQSKHQSGAKTGLHISFLVWARIKWNQGTVVDHPTQQQKT